MSFFFTQKKQQIKPVSQKPTPANKSSKDTLNRLGCKVCPLNSVENFHPKMQPDLADETDIYILGDQPTDVDDEKGKHFTGEVGKLLDAALGDSSRVSFDNVIRDFDHHKITTQWVAMESCRGLVTQSVERAKPRLLLGLGVLPLQWVLGSSDLENLRGRIFAVQVGKHPCYFVPTLHPAEVIKFAYDKAKPMRSKGGACLKFDVQRAFEALKLDQPIIDGPAGVRAGIRAFNGQSAGQLAPLLKLMGEAARAPERAIDLETSTLRPYAKDAKILTVALSYGTINFSFALDHPKAGWKEEEKQQILEAFAAVLYGKGDIIAHNTPFEVEWLISLFGKDAIYHNRWECTMMQSHFIDERRGKRGGGDEQFQPNPYQALDFLIKQYFGISYKPLFKIDRKNMMAADLDEMLLYNAADTKYTLRLYCLQTKLLIERGLYEAYQEARLRQPTVALMQHIGIDIDHTENQKQKKQLEAEIKPIEANIFALPEVQQFIKDRKSFNPASGPDLIRIFKDYIKVGKALLNAEGKESTDKSVLDKISHPLAGYVDNLRNRSHILSTYVLPFERGTGGFVWPDGRVHPSFNTTFARTGRTSADGPNQQNWPSRRDKWVRRQIVAPSGHVLVAFDYGQLEACTAAMCTKDKVLVQALWDDYDIHMEWAQRAAQLFPPFMEVLKGDMKAFRSIIKNKMVFAALFGAKMESINGYLVNTMELDVPLNITAKLMDEFWDKFRGTLNWQKRTMAEYYQNGYIATPTGRRRHYPLTKNEGVNFPIQSLGCDIVCHAMVKLSQEAADTGNWWLHPIWNIHDDMTFSIPDDPKILEEAIETIYRIMLDMSDFDFVNVPLSVSGSIGKNWLDMDDIGKFWSHKDL